MRVFFSALFFLTIIPSGRYGGPLAGASILYFPVVGILIGGGLIGVDLLGSLLLDDELRALMDVAFLALITGALHLDGLADSADALYFHHDPPKALRIMKDPRTGVMGVLALIFCLAFKWAALLALDVQQCWLWFLAAPGLARSGQVVGLVFMRDAREVGGVGKALYQKGKYQYLTFCSIPLALLFWISTPVGLAAVGGFIVINVSLLAFFRYRLGGMTGDTFGALTEILETFFLVCGAGICHSIT